LAGFYFLLFISIYSNIALNEEKIRTKFLLEALVLGQAIMKMG
jgi:hypothetical protein